MNVVVAMPRIDIVLQFIQFISQFNSQVINSLNSFRRQKCPCKRFTDSKWFKIKLEIYNTTFYLVQQVIFVHLNLPNNFGWTHVVAVFDWPKFSVHFVCACRSQIICSYFYHPLIYLLWGFLIQLMWIEVKAVRMEWIRSVELMSTGCRLTK